jgi:hypothetical protein
MPEEFVVAAIQSAEKSEEAAKENGAESASAWMETLDKLQEFKRYTLALVVLFIWGGAIALMGLGILALVWRGQYDSAIESAKWLIALVGMSVTGILGFYFGSNAIGKAA